MTCSLGASRCWVTNIEHAWSLSRNLLDLALEYRFMEATRFVCQHATAAFARPTLRGWVRSKIIDDCRLTSFFASASRERPPLMSKTLWLFAVRNDCFAEYGFPITTPVASTAHRTCSRPLHVNPDSNDTPPTTPLRAFAQANNDSPALLPRAEPPPLLTNSVTCGYTSGLWYSAVTCSPDQTCTYYTTPYSAPNFGCCDSVGQSCGYVSTCIDYNTRNSFVGAYLYLQGDDFYWYVYSCPPVDSIDTNTGLQRTADPRFRTVKQLCSTVRNTPLRELIPSCRTLVRHA